MDTKGTGLRFNEGKIRHDLVPAIAQNEYAKVLTVGAQKYAERNWEKGMSWSKVVASLERHLNAFKRGEDIDPETGLYHTAQIMCNAAFLTEYLFTYPQGDDRPKWYKMKPKIGLDIDEVLADFITHYNKLYGVETPVEFWNYDEHMVARLAALKDDANFWMSIPVKTQPRDIPFEPTCYITSRVCDTSITKQWLADNGFPTVPVYTVPHGVSKAKYAKEIGIDWFVDDRFENFVELNEAGVCCFLFDAPHNQRYDVQSKRIKSLKDLPLVGRR